MPNAAVSLCPTFYFIQDFSSGETCVVSPNLLVLL